MGFLYGDSSPSPLQGDFMEFLRETLDFCVRCLDADRRLTEQRERAATLQRAGEATSVQRLRGDEMDATVESCGASINRNTAELVRAECARVRSVGVAEVSK